MSQAGISLMTPPELAPEPHSLPAMLHSLMRRPMTSCSKGAWGLFVLSRGLGILTETAISPSALRWNLPPALSCNPKQLDSVTRSTSETSEKQTGLSPSLIPCSKGLIPGVPQDSHATTPEGLATWALPASVALTEGILVSFFSSA